MKNTRVINKILKLAIAKNMKSINELKFQFYYELVDYTDERYAKLIDKTNEKFNELFIEFDRKCMENIDGQKFEKEQDSIDKFKENTQDFFDKLFELSNEFVIECGTYMQQSVRRYYNELSQIIAINGITKSALDKEVKEILSLVAKEIAAYGDALIEEFNTYTTSLWEQKSNKTIANMEILVRNNEYNLKDSNIDGNIKYIEKYSELNKLAESLGFKNVRIKGSHGIFKNDRTGLAVVIPQGRNIGRGLSLLIQKQLIGGYR